MEQGVLKLDGCDLKVGDQVRFGHQELVFVPNGLVGKFAPTIVIETSQGIRTTVLLEEDAYDFQDAGFFASVSCNENIALTVGGNHVPSDEEWVLADWSFEGVVTGNLYDACSSHQLPRLSKLKEGTTYIGCCPAIEHLSGRPIVVLSIIHPDGLKEAIQVDIASIVLSKLPSKIDEYKASLSDLIYTTSDPNIRDKKIKASKQMLAKVENLLNRESEKTKIGSIIKDYDLFLKENQALFESAVHASKILSLSNAAIRESFIFEDNKEIPAWREEDPREITEFLHEVDKEPRLFRHLPITIKNIREQLEVIDMHFYKHDA